MRPRRPLRFYVAVALVPFPSAVKIFAYRHLLGYSIGRNVRIGMSLIEASQCLIDDDVVVGHGNAFVSVQELAIGARARIGHLNVVRGGRVRLGHDVEILRLNEFNAIPFPAYLKVDSRLSVGNWTTITTGHKIDYTGPVTFGDEVIIAGRNSSFWTHTRGITSPITLGDRVYVGSEVRMGPGAAVPSGSIVGIGAVVVKAMDEYPGYFFAGVPARPQRPVTESDGHLLFNRPPDPSCAEEARH
jgi:acetyltransferase-like isoleucine patch superfamily enzyme